MFLVPQLVIDVKILFQMLHPQQLFPGLEDLSLLALGTHRVNQHLGVFLLRICNQFPGGVLFDDLAAVENAHPVAERRHQRQVVGNEQHGHVVGLLQFFQQFQNTCLNGHVQIAGRLIGNQKFRAASQCQCNDDTLPLSAGKLMGVFIHHAARIGQFDLFQQLFCLLLRRLFLHTLVLLPNDVRHNGAHGEHRVQTAHGVLENHGNFLAPDFPLHLLFFQRQQVLTVQQNFAGLNAARGAAQ